MKKLFLLASLAIVCVMMMTACKLKSEGDLLEPIVTAGTASLGKTYCLTLNQINIERDSTGAYVRLFDAKYNTIFVYVPANMNNKILNLKRDSKYIYKFKITKNDKTSTLSGDLIEVAELDGKPVSGTLKDKEPTACSLVLDGPAAKDKTVTIAAIFKDKATEDGKKKLLMRSPDGYDKEVTLIYGDDLAKKADELKKDEKYKVTLKVENIDWRVFGNFISAEKAQ